MRLGTQAKRSIVREINRRVSRSLKYAEFGDLTLCVFAYNTSRTREVEWMSHVKWGCFSFPWGSTTKRHH